MKLLITESQVKRLTEYIKPEEAYNDEASVQTILDGKRGVAFVALQKPHQIEKYKKIGLGAIKIKKNPYNAYIVYNPEYENDAKELVQIADENDGYLPSRTSAELLRRIGSLLSYDPESVEEFIKDKAI